MAEVELKFHVNIAHQFFLGQVFALFQERVHFTTAVAQQIVERDFQRIGGGQDLDSGDVAQLALLKGTSATVANVGDHANNLVAQTQSCTPNSLRVTLRRDGSAACGA